MIFKSFVKFMLEDLKPLLDKEKERLAQANDRNKPQGAADVANSELSVLLILAPFAQGTLLDFFWPELLRFLIRYNANSLSHEGELSKPALDGLLSVTTPANFAAIFTYSQKLELFESIIGILRRTQSFKSYIIEKIESSQ